MSLIHHTQGSRRHYLDRHDWPEGGPEMQQFRAGLNAQDKQKFSELQGESFGERYLEEVRGYEPDFGIDQKTISQGFDAIYWDPQKQEQVVVEYKGQNSRESELQRNPGWSIDTCNRIKAAQFPYQDVSTYEQQAAERILNHQEAGGVTRYEVIRTYVSPQTGRFWTQLEKQTRLEKGLDEPAPAQTLSPQQEQSQGRTPSLQQQPPGLDLDYGF